MDTPGFCGCTLMLTESKELAAVTCCGHEICMVCLCQLTRDWQLFLFCKCLLLIFLMPANKLQIPWWSRIVGCRCFVLQCSKHCVLVWRVRPINNKMLHSMFLPSSLELFLKHTRIQKPVNHNTFFGCGVSVLVIFLLFSFVESVWKIIFKKCYITFSLFPSSHMNAFLSKHFTHPPQYATLFLFTLEINGRKRRFGFFFFNGQIIIPSTFLFVLHSDLHVTIVYSTSWLKSKKYVKKTAIKKQA